MFDRLKHLSVIKLLSMFLQLIKLIADLYGRHFLVQAGVLWSVLRAIQV